MLGFQNGLEIVGELLARIAKHDDLLQELSLNPASVCSFQLLSFVVEGSQADPIAARTVPFCGQLRSCHVVVDITLTMGVPGVFLSDIATACDSCRKKP